MKIAFILGASNDINGKLSDLALSRIDIAESLCKKHPELYLAPTGGFGKFNRASEPHRDYMRRELLCRKLPVAEVSADELLSAHTVEDAITIKSYCELRGIESFGVITSAFHIRRSQYIFSSLIPNATYQFFPSENPEHDLERRCLHEQSALQKLKDQGGVLVSGKLYRPS